MVIFETEGCDTVTQEEPFCTRDPFNRINILKVLVLGTELSALPKNWLCFSLSFYNTYRCFLITQPTV